jgi:peptidoglycan hydrolase CwlO-like protein
MTRSQLKSIIQEVVKRKLQEQGATDIDPAVGETGLSDADKKELANLKSQSDKITTNVKKIEGEVAKLQQTIQPKIQRAERMKAKLQKQQADIIRKQQAIQDKA